MSDELEQGLTEVTMDEAYGRHDADHARLKSSGDLAYDPDCPRCRREWKSIGEEQRWAKRYSGPQGRPISKDVSYFGFWSAALFLMSYIGWRIITLLEGLQ